MSKPVTHQIYERALTVLEKNPEGVRWKDLLQKINATGKFHPKTVNGCVWKLTEKFPKDVYKPEKGVFRLTKYKK